MLQKSLSLSADTLCYDLEDSVAPNLKSSARESLTSFLAQPQTSPSTNTPRPEFAVRINAVSTPHALADLTTLLSSPSASTIDTLVIPKVDSASDLHFVTDVLRHLLPKRHSPTSTNPLKIIALIESARSIIDLKSICAASPYLDGLIFAAEDFALDLSLTRTPSLSEFLYARSSIVAHARAFNLPSTIDLVCTQYSSSSGPSTAILEQECEQGKNMGFNGKQCIHPSQVNTVQRIFSPSDAEVEWAVRIVVGDAKAQEQGRGAWTLEGKMVDAPVVGRAMAVVERARRCSVDVRVVEEKWAGQEAT
jgi:citrate lyase subunit beta-like protein